MKSSPGRHLFVAEEDLGVVIVGPRDLGEPRQTRDAGLEGVLAAYLGPQHEQLHLQGLVGLRRQRKGVVDAAAAGFEKLHILEFDAAAALGRKGKDAEAELVRGHLLDQGRVDAAAHDGVVNPARLLLFHDDPLHPLVADAEGGERSQQGQEQGELGFHGRVLCAGGVELVADYDAPCSQGGDLFGAGLVAERITPQVHLIVCTQASNS